MYTPKRREAFVFNRLACGKAVEKGEGYLCTSLHL